MAARYQLGFIGAGNMAEAIAAGVLRGGLMPAADMIASDPADDRRRLFSERYAIATTADGRAVLADSARVLLAVKPQVLSEVMNALAGAWRPDHLIITILAGVAIDRIAQATGCPQARIVRVMPNLPLAVGAGISAVVAGRGAGPEDVAFVRRLFETGGQTVVLDDESLLDAVTAVSGSGPAYFYYIVEAIEAAGAEAGLPAPLARRLAEYACLGAARMMVESAEAPAELRRRVTSRGGTTQAAIEVMEAAGVSEAIRRAVLAAHRRARELGGGA